MTKMSPTLESLFIGKEPVFDDNISLSSVLSWYSSQFGPKESKQYTIDYLKYTKVSSSIIDKVSDASENLFKNLGFVCRITLNNSKFDKVDWISKRIAEIICYNPDTELRSQFANIIEPPIDKSSVDYIIVSEYINEIEGHIDEFIKTKTSSFNCYDYLINNNITNKNHINQIIEYYNPLYTEIELAFTRQDDQLVESYVHWTRSQLSGYKEFVGNIIHDCEKILSNTITIRKQRKKKVVSLDKKVSNLKYQKECIEYKLVSINPVDIIGAKMLLVFNTRYKTLCLYKAIDDSGLSVKSTTIEGFDESLSVKKRLRKPDVQLKSVFDKNILKKTIWKAYWEKITTKEQPITGRVNEDVVLLKVLK